MRKLTNEEKVAVKLGNLMSDFRLNLKMIGSYIALTQPMEIHKRMLEMTEHMEQHLDHLDQHYAMGVEYDWETEEEEENDRV